MKFSLTSSAAAATKCLALQACQYPPTSSAFVVTTTRWRTTPSSSLCASGGKLSARPIGIGSASPRTLITNLDLESVHDTTDEWIRTRTGIQSRRVLVHEGTRGAHPAGPADEAAPPVPETLRALGIEAARRALSMSGTSPLAIDLVICATSSPDDLFGDAPSIAHAVGCDPSRVVAFDLTAACSGFLFGIVTASQYLNYKQGNALVIGADALTRWVDWDDRNSCILFGDGAGAMVLTTGGTATAMSDGDDGEQEVDDGFGILGYAMHSNGGGYDDLKCM